MIAKEECPPSFCDVYLLWKLKHCLCHTYYYILLTYVSLKSHVDGIVLCVEKNIFRFEGIATIHNSTVHLLFVCTWLLLFYSNTTTAFYHFLYAYPVVLNFLVSLIMCYIYCLMLLIIVVLDCWMCMEHFLLWLLEIAAY